MSLQVKLLKLEQAFSDLRIEPEKIYFTDSFAEDAFGVPEARWYAYGSDVDFLAVVPEEELKKIEKLQGLLCETGVDVTLVRSDEIRDYGAFGRVVLEMEF